MKKLSKKNNPDQEKNKFQKANEKIDAGKKAVGGVSLLAGVAVVAKKTLIPLAKKIIQDIFTYPLHTPSCA